MRTKKQPIEIIEEQKFGLDWEKTIFLNLAWIMFAILWLVFFILAMNVVSNIESKVIQTIALIGTLFCMLKFATWMGFPTLYEKDKLVNKQ